MLSDSTNAHLTGSSLNEKIVIEPLEKIFSKSRGRIITGTFSSIIERLQIIMETAEKFGRKVVLLGRGMNNYYEIAKKLHYIKTQKNTIIEMSEANKLPDSQVCICCTGAQGERYAALMRIATGESNDTHFKYGDTLILSSSVIPGNERKVQELMDIVMEQKVQIHHYRQSHIHAGGHAREEDVKQMISETKPKIFVPIYGNRFMIHANAKIAQSLGYQNKDIFIARNGQIMEFTKTESRLTHIFANHRTISIDGYVIGSANEKTFSERLQLLNNGVLVINLSHKQGNTKAHLLTHGFVDLKEFPEIEKELIELIETLYKRAQGEKKNREEMIKLIRKSMQNTIFKKLGKEPVIIIA